MERPSFALMGAFCVAQLISSIIAAYADWGFSEMEGISGGWIGIVWIWNLIWFLPLDGIKFGIKFGVRRWNAARGTSPTAIKPVPGVKLSRTTSRAASIHGSLYSNRTSFLSRAQRSVGLKKGTRIDATELRRVGSHQVRSTGDALQR